MRYLLSLFIVLFSSIFSLVNTASGLSLEQKIEMAKERCSQPSQAPILYSNVYKFGMSRDEMDQKYKEVYEMDARLLNSAYYDTNLDTFISTSGKETELTKFPAHFVKSVILHVENALRLNYVNYIFFPDMGHSHMFVPQDYYDAEISPADGTLYDKYSMIYEAPGLKTLYHTAEQLQMVDDNNHPLSDRYLQWRFYTRNPIIDSNGNIEIHTNLEGKGFNTVHNLEGYKYYAGFYISSNKNACFPYEKPDGSIEYFDLSAFSLPYDCSQGDCN